MSREGKGKGDRREAFERDRRRRRREGMGREERSEMRCKGSKAADTDAWGGVGVGGVLWERCGDKRRLEVCKERVGRIKGR